MLSIADSLKNKLQEINLTLAAKYKNGAQPGREALRALLEQAGGKIRRLRKLTPAELRDWTDGQSIAAVDGSVNQVGGNHPHYIALLQAMAKGTRPGELIVRGDIYVPLLVQAEETNTDGPQSRIPTRKMAVLEMQAAADAIKAFNPKLLLMDGSLVHFRIEDAAAWEELAALALDRGVYLVGVTEEIGTRVVSEAVRRELPEGMRAYYDRELLFGLLDYGESLEVTGGRVRDRSGLRTCFVRSAYDPHAVGVDMLQEQVEAMPAIVDLLFTLTPPAGRGVPVWLDIIDSEVRLTDEMAESLIDAYLDADLKQKLFVPKRKNRMY